MEGQNWFLRHRVVTGVCAGLALMTVMAVVQHGQEAATQANPPASPRMRPVTLITAHGTGILTTRWFHAPPDWQITWSYDCRPTGETGNFIVNVYGSGNSLVDGAVNELDWRGSGSTYEHQGGRVYLNVDSGCRWKLRAHT